MLAKELVSCGALRFGSFKLASGRTSSYYVDVKQASSRPALLRAIAQEIAPRVAHADVLAGVELGAVPILVAVALESQKPYAIIRKKPKEHGTGNRIEGVDVAGKRVVVIEDVTTSGTSVLDAVTLLRESGAAVEQVETVVDRGEGAQEALRARDVRLGSLINAQDLLRLQQEARA